MVATKSNRQARCLAPCQCHSRGEYYSIVVGKRRLFFPETKALDRRNNRFDATRGTRGPTRFSYLSALFAAIQGVFSCRWYGAGVFVIHFGCFIQKLRKIQEMSSICVICEDSGHVVQLKWHEYLTFTSNTSHNSLVFLLLSSSKFPWNLGSIYILRLIFL